MAGTVAEEMLEKEGPLLVKSPIPIAGSGPQ